MSISLRNRYSSYLLLWFMKIFFVYTNGRFNSVGAINFINSWHHPGSHVPTWLHYSLFDNSPSLSLLFLNLMFWISHLLCKDILKIKIKIHMVSIFVHAIFEFFCWIGVYENFLPQENIHFSFYFRIYINYWKSFMIINLACFSVRNRI